jgi:hypothetical protein
MRRVEPISGRKLSQMNEMLSDGIDQLGYSVNGLLLQDPLGTYDAPHQDTTNNNKTAEAEATVLASQPNDPGVHIDPADPAGTGTGLHAGAEMIRLRLNGGISYEKIPRRGYARLQSTDAEDGEVKIEIISYYQKWDNHPDYGLCLTGVRRGLAFPYANDSSNHPAGTPILFIQPTELPPLTIASPGLFTLEGGATVTNAAGNQVAQQFRRLIAQALPQEEVLEYRWEKQSHYHALLAQRHGSLMSAFPFGYRRTINKPPRDNRMAGSAEPDRNVGVRPAIVRLPITSNHLGRRYNNGREWTRNFSQERFDNENPLAQGLHEYLPVTSHVWEDELTPEGLRLNGSALGYPAHRKQGALANRGILSLDGGGGNARMKGRMYGFWLKPTQKLSGTVTLFDLRAPRSAAGKRFAAPTNAPDFSPQPTEEGNDYYQNRVTLEYVEQVQQLVLTIANDAVEHLNDHGPVLAIENFELKMEGAFPWADKDAPYIDPRTLGTKKILDSMTLGVNPLAPKRPLNFVQHRYQLDKADGLKENMWHHIQFGFAGNDPGHMSIMVNGIAGKDVLRAGTMRMDKMGDYMTVPTMRLKTKLGSEPIKTTGSKGLYVGDAGASQSKKTEPIRLDAFTYDPDTNEFLMGARALGKILPKRGCIRIGNEFISYEDIQGDTLKHCVRARRQDSTVDNSFSRPVKPEDPPAREVELNKLWIYLEKHEIDDPVYPGGIRFSSAGKLWQGETKLVREFRNGDPQNDYITWDALKDGTSVHPTMGIRVIQPTDTQIALANVSPVVNEIPPCGYAIIDWRDGNYAGQTLPKGWEVIYYDNGGAQPGTLNPGILNNVERGQFGTTASYIPCDRVLGWIPHIFFISIEVDSDPTGMFPDENTGNPQAIEKRYFIHHSIQLRDNSDRIEWINYSNIGVKNGKFFFVDQLYDFRYVFDMQRRSRGRQRTAFAGADIPGGQSLYFPAGSQVLPVQMNTSRSYQLLTGDLCTLVSAQGGSQQVCIRYASTDGFHRTAGTLSDPDKSWDTYNYQFTFTEKINLTISGTYELVSWPGWAGRDLSNNKAQFTDSMPATTLPNGDKLAVKNIAYFGGPDPDASPGPRQGGSSAAPAVIIDSLYAGNLPDSSKQNQVEFFGNNASASKPVYETDETNGNYFVTWLAKGASVSNFFVKFTNKVYIRSTDFGFINIGGEIFAYEHDASIQDEKTIKLIARGLFGSEPIDHRGPEPVIFVPIGPVFVLDKALTNTVQEINIAARSRGHKNRRTDIDPSAPALMLMDLESQKMELITAPDRFSTPWLRGMYNTTPNGNWAPQNGNTGTLVIGWWPRYPSAHPHTSSPVWNGDEQQKNILLRNRMYAWMSYPIRFYDMYLTGGNGLADITLISDGEGTFNVSAMALDKGFDWSGSMNNAMKLIPGNATDVSSIFSRYNQRSVDGIEMRVRFEYANPPLQATKGDIATFLYGLARNANTAPMIGNVKLRARAPTKIIQVEESH